MASVTFPLEYDVIPTKPVVQIHLIVDCVLVAFAWLVVGLRLMARTMSGAGMGWDDYLIVAALPQGLGMLIMQGMYSQLGVGYPLTEVSQNLAMILRILVGYVLVFALSTLTIKLSVLCFYNRIFVNKNMKLMTKIVMVWVLSWSFGNLLQIFLICTPFAKSYDPNITYGHCGNQKASFIAIGAFNAVTDVAILALPITTIWSLKARTGTKVYLLGVFLIGVLTTIISIVRIASMNHLDLAADLTGTMVYADFLSAFEVNLGIVCVSLPTMGPIYHRYIRRGRGTTTSPSGGRQSGMGSTNALRTFGTGPRKHYRLDDSSTGRAEAYSDKAHVYYAPKTRIEGGGGAAGSPASSDIELNPVRPGGQGSSNAIQVETQWVVEVTQK